MEENDTECVPATRTQAAYTKPHVDPINTARTTNRTVVDRKNHSLFLDERYHLSARLHSRSLLGKHELAASEILVRLGKQKRHLKRKEGRLEHLLCCPFNRLVGDDRQ